MARRLKTLQGPLVENPIGYHVRLPYQGRELLGTVKNCYRTEEYAPRVVLQIQHFNGEMWPIEPSYTVVEVLE